MEEIKIKNRTLHVIIILTAYLFDLHKNNYYTIKIQKLNYVWNKKKKN